MDHQKFDALARAFAPAASRRKLLRWATVTGLVAAFGRGQVAEASHCRYMGCGCTLGTRHECVPGMICCDSAPGTPGGAGTCQFPEDCGAPPPPPPACTGEGCFCNAGTFAPCDDGLICCSDNPGLPGGPGTCLPDYQCAQPVQCIDAGCVCEYNDPLGCGGGLVCCAAQSGNFCVGFDQCCRGGGSSCALHSQCCSGQCFGDGTCAY